MAALLAVAVLALFAPFTTLCVAGGHAGIEFLFIACCGGDSDADPDCAEGCTDSPADFGASLGAAPPLTVVPALQAVLVLPDPVAVEPSASRRASQPAKSLHHATLAAVFLLL